MRKYFVYELKKNAFTIGCLTLIAVIVYLTPILCRSGYDLIRHDSACLWVSSVIGGALALLVPVWIFQYKMKKRSVDLYYSLPLSRTGILAVKFLIGLIAVCIPYAVSYWLGAFVVMAKAAADIRIAAFNAVYYLPHFFLMILLNCMIFSISAFAFTRANSTLDGILFVAFLIFAAFLVVYVLQNPTQGTPYEDSGILQSGQKMFSNCYLPFYPVDFVTTAFQSLITPQSCKMPVYNTAETINAILGIAYTTLLAAGSAAGIFLSEKRAKAENAEQPSESLFGYRVMIPLFTVLSCAVFDFRDTLYFSVFFVMIAVASFMITALYKRTMKIGKIQAIVYACSLGAGLLLSFLCWL